MVVMKKNCYQILKINPDLVSMTYNDDPVKKVVRGPNSRDKLIKDAYERRINDLFKEYEEALEDLLKKQKKEIEFLKYGLGFNNVNKKIDEINETLKKMEEEHQNQITRLKSDFEEIKDEVTNAYNQIATEGLRAIYERKMIYKSERPYLDGDSAYDFFAISEEYIYSLNAAKADSLLKQVYHKQMDGYKEALMRTNLDEKRRKEIENDIALIDSYYNKICNMESRIKYRDELDIKEREKKREVMENLVKEKCSKADQFDPELIETITSNENAPLKSVRYKKSINPVRIILMDKKYRNIILTKTGEIVFRTTPNNTESYISEYEVSRIVNGKERVDKIYANLNLQQLSIDKETGNPVDPDYYNCVVNELLSEGVIRGAKYNKGYIGGVEKNKNGRYQIILSNKELDPDEKENLAAVMIYDEQQHSNLSVENEKERNGER